MNDIKCNNCGSGHFFNVDKTLICKYCDSMFVQEKGMVETSISLDSDVNRLLDLIESDPLNTKRYANLVLDIDPTNSKVLNLLL